MYGVNQQYQNSQQYFYPSYNSNYQNGYQNQYQTQPITQNQMNQAQYGYGVQPAPMPSTPQQDNGDNRLWVVGIEGAKAYPIARNGYAQLWNSEDPSIFFEKRADAEGRPYPMRTFKVTEITETARPTQPPEKYATQRDFEALQEKYKELSDIVNALKNPVPIENGG